MGRLYMLAESQCGLVTVAQAVGAGIARSSVEYHARPSGQLERCARGLYRLRRFPVTEHAPLWRAYLPVAAGRAALSHASALWLLGLIPRRPVLVHLTLPRSERWRATPEGGRLHFIDPPLNPASVIWRQRLPVTIPEVAFVATMRKWGLDRELEAVIEDALSRGQVSAERLRAEWPPATLELLERLLRVAAPPEGEGGTGSTAAGRGASPPTT